ncbi:pancreatic lipase-related protein 2 [Diachasma alloeum]|uniref:pancreatic lipase-related protein 2 n=1 Tax=Diachasma alloeum TaxID=454923 RepID=UPI00073832D3|nr:pancreatic lipase-related protein 2 [Diachasma alloeum]
MLKLVGSILCILGIPRLRADPTCYGDLGCFPNDYPWTAFLRPFPEPQSPQEVNTTFFFSNRIVNRTVVTKDPEIVIPNGFNGTKATYFITHGYSSSTRPEWFRNLSDALITARDCNVFAVDWEKGSSGMYFTAAANTRMVAAEIARLIRYLTNSTSLTPSNVHLLGHSLGAHIMGYVGKSISGIRRITALDPAQPGFEGKNPLIRLNGSDAQFVDVIHTDGRPFLPLLGLGYTSGVGNVDFFVNGGKFQPNCVLDGENFPYKRLAEIPKITIAVLYNLASCSHTRAPRYMAAAIKEPCNMWGYRYNATQATLRYENFIIDDECDVDNCTPMGLTTHHFPALGNFAMETSGTYPFCKNDGQADREMARAVIK